MSITFFFSAESLKEFGKLISGIEDERDRMVSTVKLSGTDSSIPIQSDAVVVI